MQAQDGQIELESLDPNVKVIVAAVDAVKDLQCPFDGLRGLLRVYKPEDAAAAKKVIDELVFYVARLPYSCEVDETRRCLIEALDAKIDPPFRFCLSKSFSKEEYRVLSEDWKKVVDYAREQMSKLILPLDHLIITVFQP